MRKNFSLEEIPPISVRMLLIGRDTKMKCEEMCETYPLGTGVRLTGDSCKSKRQ
jgi:hypothetical protein